MAGPAHPQFGYGRNAWLSGTAAWMYVAETQWILGIRPTFRGLEIAPLIPSGWEGFEATRVFRGRTYRIRVTRRGAGQGGGSSPRLRVDGRPIAGSVVPLPDSGDADIEVEVELGQ
jgi:cellobiose phosphorylase